MRLLISARFENTCFENYPAASSSKKKDAQMQQALRVYGGEGVGRRTISWHFIAGA